MKVSIQPYTITLIATTLEFKVNGPGPTEGTVDIFYRLTKADGGEAESGNKYIPIAALSVLENADTEPIDITSLNAILGVGWGITAISQINPPSI